VEACNTSAAHMCAPQCSLSLTPPSFRPTPASSLGRATGAAAAWCSGSTASVAKEGKGSAAPAREPQQRLTHVQAIAYSLHPPLPNLETQTSRRLHWIFAERDELEIAAPRCRGPFAGRASKQALKGFGLEFRGQGHESKSTKQGFKVEGSGLGLRA